MKIESKLAAVGRFVKQFTLIEIVIICLAGVVCWLTGRQTFLEYAYGLIWAGVAISAFAALSFFGGNVPGANTRYNFGGTLLRQSAYERTKSIMSNHEDNLSVVTFAGLNGLTTIILGVILLNYVM